MELTERDMYYVVRGRMSNRYIVRFIAVMLAVLVPSFLLFALGGVPGMVVSWIWLCGGFVVVFRYGMRTEKATKAEAKKMFEEWQFYTGSVIAASESPT